MSFNDIVSLWVIIVVFMRRRYDVYMGVDLNSFIRDPSS